MKKSINVFKSMLMLALLCLPFVFTSCDDDDEEEVTTVCYQFGFETVQSNLVEMYQIETVYKQALGVSSTTFYLEGTVSECNSTVKAACESAEATLEAMTISGSYTIVVTNTNTGNDIYTYQIN